MIYHIKSLLLVLEPTDLQKREFRILNSWQCSSPQNFAIIIKERKHLLPEMFHVLELTIGIYFVIFWNFHTRKEKLFVTVVVIVFLFFNFKGNCLLLGHNLKRKKVRQRLSFHPFFIGISRLSHHTFSLVSSLKKKKYLHPNFILKYQSRFD